ncbi:response regulator transcription factor [Micromonospora sp. NPDC047548]|uniref:response regulator transcription factor n=1 Tax=Micromonospora sp. NPDC047548 TaxID=3155624 RepID=UPI003402FBB6
MTAARTPIRIILLDDHTLFRESLREALETDSELSVVGETGRPEAAVDMILSSEPDVVLVDAHTPEALAERVRQIGDLKTKSRLLVLTWHEDPWLIRSAVTNGVGGYVLKSITRLELVCAIRSLFARERRIVMMVSADTLTYALQAGRSGAEGISRREREALILASHGLSNAQIGRRLSITEGTVKRHLSNVYMKLGAASRVDAVNKAMMATLIPSVLGGRM